MKRLHILLLISISTSVILFGVLLTKEDAGKTQQSVVSERFIQVLKDEEGLRLKVYRDTSGKLSIGYGRNLSDKGISREEALYLLKNDIAIASVSAQGIFNDFDKLSKVRQEVIIDMIFNLGESGFLRFSHFIQAIKDQDFERASREILNSLAARQAHDRYVELSDAMRLNTWGNQK